MNSPRITAAIELAELDAECVRYEEKYRALGPEQSRLSVLDSLRMLEAKRDVARVAYAAACSEPNTEGELRERVIETAITEVLAEDAYSRRGGPYRAYGEAKHARRTAALAIVAHLATHSATQSTK